MTTIPRDWLNKLASTEAHLCREHHKDAQKAFKDLCDTSDGSSLLASLQEEMGAAMQEALENAKEEEKKENPLAASLQLPPISLSSAASSPSSLHEISLPSIELFSHLVGAMTHLHVEGKTETTFFLDTERFANSPFHGAKIVIEEYTTAPKSFNIYLVGEAHAAALFELHAPALLDTFHKGKFGFTVHRLETHLFPKERYIVKRKEEHTDQPL